MHLVSVSRRTDIPRYFARWFSARRKAGFAESRNVFGGEARISLSDQDVLGFLFWTKYARPFQGQLAQLREERIPYVFQYTITGYGRDLEPYAPRLEQVLDDFRTISGALPDPGCIQWRYDPIVVSERYPFSFHEEQFANLARALRGTTRVVNISAIEPYLKTVRRVGDMTVLHRRLDPNRHKAVAKQFPKLLEVDERFEQLVCRLQAIASENGMEMRSCANPEWQLPSSKCCSIEMFLRYGNDLAARLKHLSAAPSRPGCGCIESRDIGMDNTCLGGCRYCYVVNAHSLAVKNYRQHDPNASRLR